MEELELGRRVDLDCGEGGLLRWFLARLGSCCRLSRPNDNETRNCCSEAFVAILQQPLARGYAFGAEASPSDYPLPDGQPYLGFTRIICRFAAGCSDINCFHQLVCLCRRVRVGVRNPETRYQFEQNRSQLSSYQLESMLFDRDSWLANGNHSGRFHLGPNMDQPCYQPCCSQKPDSLS